MGTGLLDATVRLSELKEAEDASIDFYLIPTLGLLPNAAGRSPRSARLVPVLVSCHDAIALIQ